MKKIFKLLLVNVACLANIAFGATDASLTKTKLPHGDPTKKKGTAISAQSGWSRTELMRRLGLLKTFIHDNCARTDGNNDLKPTSSADMKVAELVGFIRDSRIAYDLRIQHVLKLAMLCRQCPEARNACNNALELINPLGQPDSQDANLASYMNNIYTAQFRTGTPVPASSPTVQTDNVVVAKVPKPETTVTTTTIPHRTSKPQVGFITLLGLSSTGFLWNSALLLAIACLLTTASYWLVNKYGTRKITALVVDDDILSIVALKNMLKQFHIHVEAFQHPKDAIQAFKKSKFNLIFLDYTMPDMRGDELLRVMNEDLKAKFKDYHSKIREYRSKVFFYTGTPLNIAMDKLRADEFEFGGVISKNISNSALRRSLQTVIKASA